MKNNIKSIILFLSTSLAIILIVSYLYNKVNAVAVDKNDVENGNYDFTLTYDNDMSDGEMHKTVTIKGVNYNVFCKEKGGSIHGSASGVAKYYYRKVDANLRAYTTRSSNEDTRKLAYLLYKNSDSTHKQQRIIWASEKNKGTEVEYSLWDSTKVSEYKEPKIKIITSDTKSKCDGKKYTIGPIKVKCSGGNEAGETTINNKIEIIDADSNKIKTSIEKSGIKNNDEFYIEIPKNELDGVKEIKLKMSVKVDYYTIDYYNFIGTGYDSNGVVKDSSGQKLIAVNPGIDSDSAYDTSENIKIIRPRLVTTKYIKKITAEDGTSLYSVSNKDMPKVTVDTKVDVEQSGRYSLKKQDTTDFNLTYGDVITYAIKVYNVGSGEAEMEDEELKSTNSDGGNIIVKNGYVYDFPNKYLEIIDEKGIWSEDSSGYKTKATRLGSTILSYEEAEEDNKEDDDKNWSSEIEIKFRVKGKEKEDNISLKNNGNTTTRKDKAVKFLKSATTKNKDCDEVKTEFAQPEVKVDTSRNVNDENRFTINMKAPDLTVMDGDTLEYCMRYYSIGSNSTVINYKAEDEWGLGLELESVKTQDGEEVEIEKTDSKIVISPPTKNGKKVNLPGVGDSGVVTDVPYYDVYIKFKVKINKEYLMNQTNGEKDYVPLLENKAKNTVNIPGGFEIKGKVFIDNLDTKGKVTQKRNSIYDSSDKLVAGIKVELLEADGVTPVEKIVNPATGEEYPTVVYTNEAGEYKFPYLRVSKINILSPDGTVDGNIDELNEYCVRFSYNGQEYENVTYAVDGGENSSYATELDHYGYDNLGRLEFNDLFKTINGKNSEEYSVMKEENKVAQVEGGTNVSPAAISEFKINAYSGKDNERIVSAKEKYRDYLNLGLVKREFDLRLENKLDSMDISINGINQQVESINGGTISETLADQDVYFQEADYYATADNGSPITSTDAELSVWVNYTIKITNESTDNFIGIVKKLNLFCDDRFDKLEVYYKDKDQPFMQINDLSSSLEGDFMGEIPIEFKEEEWKELDNTADNGTQEVKIRLHLSRNTIQYVLTHSDAFKTLETVVEISEYSTKYGGDIFGNGHGVGKPNAGKVDEDSNAGNFDLKEYKKIRKSTNPKEILEMFNKEDDCKRSLGIKLNTNIGPGGGSSQRNTNGIVFEDATVHSTENTRLGNGQYSASDNDKVIPDATVVLIDSETKERVNVFNSESKQWVDSQTTTGNDGKYVIEGFIPSKNYQIQFTYGNNTGIYNAQDYKSTTDTTEEQYASPTEVNENSPVGAENYWYSKVENKSVAKDDDTKMTSATLDYQRALELENSYKLENTAKTARFYAPIRQYGNQQTINENYIIKNMNLGLAERPRSELTINKIVDHITITTSDRRVLIDGSKGAINSTSWTDRYVQAIIDENLIYGSTLKVTYKYFITNTGEVDYMSNGEVTYSDSGINVPNTRRYYDYGNSGEGQSQVTTQASAIIDYTDNGLRYGEDELANPETDANTPNKNYWRIVNDNEIENLLDENSKAYSKTINTKLIAEGQNEALTAGQSGTPIYLTLSKVLSTDVDQDKNSLTYNNYVEIIKQTNSAGRRSYHTTTTPNKDVSEKYTTKALYYKENQQRIEKYEFNQNAKKGNNENILLSDVVNRGAPVNMKESGNQLVLSVPGDLGDPTDLEKTTLYWEPDSDIDLAGGSLQIVPPFGNQKIIWIAIGTTVAIILAGGIYLIKKKVL